MQNSPLSSSRIDTINSQYWKLGSLLVLAILFLNRVIQKGPTFFMKNPLNYTTIVWIICVPSKFVCWKATQFVELLLQQPEWRHIHVWCEPFSACTHVTHHWNNFTWKLKTILSYTVNLGVSHSGDLKKKCSFIIEN